MSARMSMRRLAVAGTMSLFVGCGPEVLDETSTLEQARPGDRRRHRDDDRREPLAGVSADQLGLPLLRRLGDQRELDSDRAALRELGGPSQPARIEAGTTTISGSGQIRIGGPARRVPRLRGRQQGQGRGAAASVHAAGSERREREGDSASSLRLTPRRASPAWARGARHRLGHAVQRRLEPRHAPDGGRERAQQLLGSGLLPERDHHRRPARRGRAWQGLVPG